MAVSPRPNLAGYGPDTNKKAVPEGTAKFGGETSHSAETNSHAVTAIWVGFAEVQDPAVDRATGRGPRPRLAYADAHPRHPPRPARSAEHRESRAFRPALAALKRSNPRYCSN